MTSPKHFLDVSDFDEATLRDMLRRAEAFRTGGAGSKHQPLAGKTLVCIFEKPSTRTRVSFQVGAQQLGGQVIILNSSESQLGRGETIADTARVLSRYADIIMIRTDSHDKLLELAEHATIPVINGLTDFSHPCQIMADIQTFEQHSGTIRGRTVAWCGDGNNVAVSWIHAAVRFGFTLRLAVPEALAPSQKVLDWAVAQGHPVEVTHDPREAVQGADCVVTDAWVSMGDTDAAQRMELLRPFQVDESVMAHAAPDALFMHCLPAHRDEEMTSAVLDGPQSVVWDEAENRLHAQKGVMAWCLEG